MTLPEQTGLNQPPAAPSPEDWSPPAHWKLPDADLVRSVLQTSTVEIDHSRPRHGMNAGMGPGLEKPKPQLLTEVCCFVTDPESGEVGEVKNFAGDSLVIAMLDILFVQMSATASTISNHLGTAINITSATASNLMTTAGTTNALGSATSASSVSIVIGIGSASATITDTGLGTRIIAGSASGQMFYMGHSVLPPITTGTTHQAQIIRNFVNTSGGTITVQECGFQVQVSNSTSIQNANTFCVIRDLISGGVAVANGKVLTVVYTIGVSGT